MTTRSEIETWFDRGLSQNAKYMIVVCDSFDHEDYPVYVSSDSACMKKYKNSGQMQRVMEVYDLSHNKEDQLNKTRCLSLPK